MALVQESTWHLEPNEASTGNSPWIFRIWAGTVALGYLLGAFYGRWLPRLCQRARRCVSRVWVRLCREWFRGGLQETQFTVESTGSGVPPQHGAWSGMPNSPSPLSSLRSPETSSGLEVDRESTEPRSDHRRRRSISPRSVVSTRSSRREDSWLMESPGGRREREVFPRSTPVMSKMLEAVSPRLPERGR